MDKILNKVNRRTTVGFATVLISGSYMASRVLGLLRDRLLASHFGIGPVPDAYTAAFRLPELLFTLLVSGAFAVAFIPVLTDHLVANQKDEAVEVSSAILNLLVVATFIVGVVMFVFAGPLTTLITPGFDAFRHDLTVNLTRIMLVTPMLFAISSVFGSIQQAHNRFFFYAIASVFYNLGIIFGILFLSPHYGIYGVAIGVVMGTLLQAAVQWLGLWGLGYSYHFSASLWHPSVRKVVKLIVPRSIDQGIDQINYTVQTVIGSRLAAGSLTAYYFANNLKNVPLVVFGSAIATAAFPGLAAKASNDNREGLIKDFANTSRMILFLVVPAATIAVIMRGYIVRILFGFGNPTTASVLGWFSATIVFESLFFLVARIFYALKDTRTPLFTSIFAIALNIVLSFVLSARFGVSGLAMAQSAVTILETMVLLYLLRRRLGHIGGRHITRGVTRILLSNVIMGSVVYILVARVLPLYMLDRGYFVVGPKFAIIGLVGLAAYLVPCYLLQLNEAHYFFNKVKTQVFQPFSLN